MTEDIIATRREEVAQKRKVKKDILQITLNAHNEKTRALYGATSKGRDEHVHVWCLYPMIGDTRSPGRLGQIPAYMRAVTAR